MNKWKQSADNKACDLKVIKSVVESHVFIPRVIGSTIHNSGKGAPTKRNGHVSIVVSNEDGIFYLTNLSNKVVPIKGKVRRVKVAHWTTKTTQ